MATAGSKEAKQLEKVKKAFEDAYRQDAKNTVTEDGVKYSITEPFVDINGTKFGSAVLLDTNFLTFSALLSENLLLTFSLLVDILVIEEDFPFRAPPLAEEPVTVGNLLSSISPIL